MKESKKEDCINCKFSALNEGGRILGCRRYPPTIVNTYFHNGVSYTTTQIVTVREDDWCGEWRKI
jgi:hypothetical protein